MEHIYKSNSEKLARQKVDEILKAGYVNTILKMIKTKIPRNLSKSDLAVFIKTLKGIEPLYFVKNYKNDRFKNNIVDLLVKNINFNSQQQNLDIKEILKSEIGTVAESGTSNDIYDRLQISANTVVPKKKEIKKDFLGVDNITDFSKILNPASATKTQYFILDSRFKNEERSTEKKLVWDYAPEKSTQPGTFSLSGNVRDIVSLKIFPFKLPYTEDADTKRQLLTLSIEELNQAFIAQQNRKFNFILYTEVNAEFIEMQPVQENDGEFKFHKVLTKLDSMTITIGDPNKLITYARDRDLITIDYFSLAPLTLITTDNPHNLSNGDIVIISNFDYGFIDPALVQQIQENNVLKNQINSEDGYEVTILGPNQFTITLDTSGILSPLPFNTKFNIYYDSKRVYIPMEIKYINPIGK